MTTTAHRSKAFEARLSRVMARRSIPARDLAAALDRTPGYTSRALNAADYPDVRLAASDVVDLAGVLGRDGLVEVLDPLLEEVGLQVVPIAPAEPVAVDRGLFDVDVALAEVKRTFLDATDARSVGGARIVRLERLELVEKLRRARGEIDELLAGLEADRGAA